VLHGVSAIMVAMHPYKSQNAKNHKEQATYHSNQRDLSLTNHILSFLLVF